MKKLLLFGIIFLSIFNISFGQNFTWVRGNNFSGTTPGVYGTMGVPSTTNNPGHRHGSATWTDASGNLWLFGGEGHGTSTTISWLNDLWKYNPTTNEWTWMRGSNGANSPGNYGTLNVPSATNDPGAREFPTFWTDNSGNFWMFGGANNAGSGWLGDLWKYNPSTNQWTWVKGFNTVDDNGVYGTMNVTAPTSQPGSRTAAAHWVDSNGDLWMFGGRGFAATGGSGLLNDLWKYSVIGNTWTWISGTNLSQQNGVYGAINTPSVTYHPGGTEFPACWTDAQGRLYLFTGRGYVGSGTPGYTNDMWRYNAVTNEWTWLKGPNLVNQNSVYGQLGVSSASTQPSGRYSTAFWKDGAGNFWLFGGLGWSGVSTPSLGSINDMYKYNPVTNEYTWMKGSTVPYTNGNYGTQGVANAANMPGARYFNNFWTGNGNFLWLMGGEGYDISSTSIDNMNDLWKFGVPCNPDSVISSNGSFICSGNSATLTANNQFPSTVAWYSSPTSTSSIGTGSVLNTSTLAAVSGNSVYSYYAQSNSCTLTPRTAFNLTVSPNPTLSINGPTLACKGANINLIASGALSYTWVGGANSATNPVSPFAASVYTVIGGNSAGCVSTKTIGVSIIPGPTLSISGSTAICKGSTLTLSASGALSYTWSNGPASASISVSPTLNTQYNVMGTNSAGCIDSVSVNIVVNPLPVISVLSKTTACLNEPILLTASGAVTYTWVAPVANTSTVSITTSSIVGINTYTVSGKDNNGCMNTTVHTISVTSCNYLGIENHSALNLLIKLYPNPSHGQFTLQYPTELNNSLLKIYTILGEVIYTEEVNGNESHLHLNLAKGLYFVHLFKDGNDIGNARLIIE